MSDASFPFYADHTVIYICAPTFAQANEFLQNAFIVV